MRIQYCTLFNDLKMKAQDLLFVHRYYVKKLLLVLLSFLNARFSKNKYFNPYNKNLKYKIYKYFFEITNILSFIILLFILVMKIVYITARTNTARCTFIHRLKGLVNNVRSGNELFFSLQMCTKHDLRMNIN